MGSPCQADTGGPSELGARASQPWPSSPQHTHSLLWQVPIGRLGHGQMDSQAGGRKGSEGDSRPDNQEHKGRGPEPVGASKMQLRSAPLTPKQNLSLL